MIDVMDIVKLIDNSLLRPNATVREVLEFVRRSSEAGFYAVCVQPFHVRTARENAFNGTKVCSVVGFPHGLSPKEIKVREAVKAVLDGAEEIDMVMNISAFKSGNFRYVEEEIKAVKRETGAILKVIIETCYLTREEKLRAVDICIEGGADFVKTSTGFGPAEATPDDVKLLKERSGDRIKVKASGGIRDLRTALSMIEAGADRIGTSSGFEIYRELTGG
ncbi:MAG: deoxyribose-phosphate aldolase [Aquificota bacterium]|nr:deoxyribose-phosphate aldolase [Aquificota bacterium]